MKKILINKNLWQTRIAITKDEELQNIYFSSTGDQPLERLYIKGVITKILPGIQTAFVDIGQEKAGFLHISEIDRELAIARMSSSDDEDGEDTELEQASKPVRQELDISSILKEGEPILVQVSKEPVYQKGAKLTTCFTLPGRFIVLMPNIPRIGISKKIEAKEERQRLKDLVHSQLPDGMGAIIRTTCEGRSAQEIGKDISFLVNIWSEISKKFANSDTKTVLHQDIDLPLQIVRDHLDNDVEAIISDSKESYDTIYKFVKQIAPEYTHKVKMYEGSTPLFTFYNIEDQIEQALERKVPLKSGGTLIIESTEAMTVIDVNTGKFTGKKSLEDTILKTNLEAAHQIVRQLRLRNIGGIIVIDFIDMSSSGNRQKLFKFFEKTLREQDKFQSVVLKVSEFGLVQMTRKRSGKTLVQELTVPCTTCHGYGFVPSLRTQAYIILRKINEHFHLNAPKAHSTIHLNPAVFEYVTHIEYNSILNLEKTYNTKITLSSSTNCPMASFTMSA
jgi:ribonuclease G